MPIKFRCPKCRQAYSIASKNAGTSLRCQKCDAKMRIPTLEPAADESPAATDEPEQTTSSAEEQPDLTAAMRNLLDDDDDIGDDDFVDLSADEIPAGVAAAVSEPGAEPENLVVDNSPPSTTPPPNAESEAADDDDLAAVLAFEEALEKEDGPAPAASVSLPDELFAEEDDDEDEGWGRSRGGDDEEMDLTPMVDVTFLLLVFFMITASFSIQKTLEVPPPNPDQQEACR